MKRVELKKKCPNLTHDLIKLDSGSNLTCAMIKLI